MGCTQMVCMMIAPLRSSLIESPRHAARFVSQIPCTPRHVPGGSCTAEQWSSLHALIVANSGVSVEISFHFQILAECHRIFVVYSTHSTDCY